MRTSHSLKSLIGPGIELSRSMRKFHGDLDPKRRDTDYSSFTTRRRNLTEAIEADPTTPIFDCLDLLSGVGIEIAQSSIALLCGSIRPMLPNHVMDEGLTRDVRSKPEESRIVNRKPSQATACIDSLNLLVAAIPD